LSSTWHAFGVLITRVFREHQTQLRSGYAMVLRRLNHVMQVSYSENLYGSEMDISEKRMLYLPRYRKNPIEMKAHP